MSNKFHLISQKALGFILIVGLSIGLVTPLAQAEAPTDTSYTAPVSTKIVDGLTAQQRAEQIDAFYTERGVKLAGYGNVMVNDADYYNIDWRIVAALAYNESTGGNDPCPAKDGVQSFNPLGYGGCTISFKNYDQAIDTVSRDIAGQIPATAKFFAGKTITQVINAYNPPSANEHYLANVTWTMNKIATINPSTVFATANASTNNQLAIK
jgi:hypothetical protein